MSEESNRRRWINLGELIALAALIVSALGVWIAWKSSSEDKPTRIVEQRSAIPLALRGTIGSNGQSLTILPADPGHALESLSIRIKGASPIEIGADGKLSAADVQQALQDHDKEPKDKLLSVPLRIDARYVEAGNERSRSGNYTLRYKWEGGGLFGGRSIRLVSLVKS